MHIDAIRIAARDIAAAINAQKVPTATPAQLRNRIAAYCDNPATTDNCRRRIFILAARDITLI